MADVDDDWGNRFYRDGVLTRELEEDLARVSDPYRSVWDDPDALDLPDEDLAALDEEF